MKRLFDLAGAGLLLVLSAPFMGAAALLVKLTSKGPTLFSHRRCGRAGRPFGCFKFRTMIAGAEEWLESDEELRCRYRDNGYKLATDRDPRVTRVGRFLRRTHLDELPQLFNVLRGEMSLVGPRPVIDEELEHYGERAEDLLSVRPGIFGEWTARGNRRPGYPERVEVELFYLDDPSVSRDVVILLRNFPVLLQGQGEAEGAEAEVAAEAPKEPTDGLEPPKERTGGPRPPQERTDGPEPA